MKHTYDRSRKVLTVYFKQKKLIGFDIHGLPVYEITEKQQTFLGLNKQDCLFRAKNYVKEDIALKPHNCRYYSLHVL